MIVVVVRIFLTYMVSLICFVVSLSMSCAKSPNVVVVSMSGLSAMVGVETG